jgi:predicted nucleotidyltransferase
MDAAVHQGVPSPPVACPDIGLVDVTRVLGQAVTALERAGIGYVLLGGLASVVLGRPRCSMDVDLLVRPEDALPTLDALAAEGFATEQTNPHWLYKGFKDGVLVDVLFKAKGDIYLDDEMLARATIRTFRGQTVRVIPPEDLIVIKAIVHDEETPRHWHDALGVLAESTIDWHYLMRRARKNPTRVMSLLFYAQSIGLVVPPATLHRLAALILPTPEGELS